MKTLNPEPSAPSVWPGLFGKEATAELLNGQSVSLLLKDLGALLGGAGVRASGARSELDTLQVGFNHAPLA